MEQLVILIIIGVISLINWLLQKSAEHKSKRPPKASPPLESHDWGREEQVFTEEPVAQRQAPPADPQAELRRFFEAMGLPLEEEPAPAPVVQPAFVEPPALPDPVVETPAPRPAAAARERVTARYAELAKGFAQAEAAQAQVEHQDARGLLASPGGLRQAMILREILGPPRGLEELTVPGTSSL